MKKQRIGVVAAANCKNNMVTWVLRHAEALLPHSLLCTGTAGRLFRKL